MSKKYLIVLAFIVLISMTAVSAQENQTLNQAGEDVNVALEKSSDDVKLEKTYFYDNKGDRHVDGSIVTHDVVKYYGDKDTKFKVEVYDADHKPKAGAKVTLWVLAKYKNKITNGNGVAYFSLNNKPGTYEVETTMDADDGSYSAVNKVKIKSTISANELVKYSTSKKKFKIKFLDTKGNPLKNKQIKLKIKGKILKIKTNSKGIVKIKSTQFKVGKNKIVAYNPVSGEKKSIPVVVLKRGTHKINIRIDDPTSYFPTKKLKNGDYVNTVYETQYKQYRPGVYVQCSSGGMEAAKHTKIVKAKFYFKNKITGKVITKTSSKVKYNGIVIKPIKGYSPYKATVWYKDKK